MMRSLSIKFTSIFFLITTYAYGDITSQIIDKLEKSNNYRFSFIQKIDEKKEAGNCTLVFDRKINCKYLDTGKIIISDGKNLIIKNKVSNIPNFYKIEDTSFYKLLDKEYLIQELNNSKVESKNGNLFLNLNYQNIDIKVFFNEENLYLKGWETTDIYNNSVSTEIKVNEVNISIDENLFDVNRFN